MFDSNKCNSQRILNCPSWLHFQMHQCYFLLSRKIVLFKQFCHDTTFVISISRTVSGMDYSNLIPVFGRRLVIIHPIPCLLYNISFSIMLHQTMNEFESVHIRSNRHFYRWSVVGFSCPNCRVDNLIVCRLSQPQF